MRYTGVSVVIAVVISSSPLRADVDSVAPPEKCAGLPSSRLQCESTKLEQYDRLITSVLDDLDRLGRQLGRAIPLGESQASWLQFRLERCIDPNEVPIADLNRLLTEVICQRELSHERWVYLESVLSDYDRDAQASR